METYKDGAFQFGNVPLPLKAITDGLSNTIMAGEKHVPLGTYGQGALDGSLYNGDNFCSCTRGGGPGNPIAQVLNDPRFKWGSYHRVVCQFVMVDGSVHGLELGIDENLLGRLCQINDGQTVSPF